MVTKTKHNQTRLFVRNQTYKLLRNKLLIGYFNSNQRLTEESLANELGVSRTPVREALHKLELEGLVKPTGKRGYRVPEDSLDDVNELFEIRAIMEGHALASISKKVPENILQSLKKIVQQTEKDFMSGHFESIFDYNTQFHDLLYSILSEQKPRLYSLIEDMREYTLRYRKNTLVHHKGVQRSIEGHKKILLALEVGDRFLCEQVMRHHINEAREDAFAAMKELKNKSK